MGLSRAALRAARPGLAVLALAAAATLVGTPIGPPARALALGPTAADRASTHAYVLADNALAQASERNVPRIERLIRDYRRRLLDECGRGAAGSPQDAQAYRLDYEIAGALWSISYGTDARAIAHFARAVERLRWSDPSIARRVGAYVKMLHGLAALKMPPVCADVRSWRASGYTQVPEHTLRFDVHVEALEPYVLPTSVLKPYLRRSDAPIARATLRLERKLLNTETVFGGDTWYALLEALDLNE
ncbi:MAG: hypothetical protein ACYCUM_01105 [Solirubrobacteraceae bacterium]